MLETAAALKADHATNQVELAALVCPDHAPQGAARVPDGRLGVVPVRIQQKDAQRGRVASHHSTGQPPCRVVDSERAKHIVCGLDDCLNRHLIGSHAKRGLEVAG